MTCVSPGVHSVELGHELSPGGLGSRPGIVGFRRRFIRPALAELQQEIAGGSRFELELESERLAVVSIGSNGRVRRPDKPKLDLTAASAPDAVLVARNTLEWGTSEVTSRVENHQDPGGSLDCGHMAENDRAFGSARQGERVSTLDDRTRIGDPSPIPDQASLLVVAAPDRTLRRSDCIH